jgi:hypothetical protein
MNIGTITFAKNGTDFKTAFTGLPAELRAAVTLYGTGEEVELTSDSN